MPVKGSVVVILHGYETVLVEHTSGSDYPPGKFGYPAGLSECGETFEKTAVREVMEECGIEINPGQLLPDGVYGATLGRKGGRTLDVDAMLFFYECDRAAKRPELLRESLETVPIWAPIADVLGRKYDMIEVSGPAMAHINYVLKGYLKRGVSLEVLYCD